VPSISPSFEPATVGRRCDFGRTGRAEPAPLPVRRLELAELTEPAHDPVAPAAPQPTAPARGEPALSFDEADLARACAGAAAAAARAAEGALAARLAATDAALRERLLLAVGELRADLRRREEAVRALVATLVAAALESLVPSLREARLSAALERVVATVAGEPRPLPPLILELPEQELPTLAPRLPALLAEAGLEGGFEVRPAADGEVVRLVCGEFWSELDAAAWAAAVGERVRATIARLPLGVSTAEEESDERRAE
jgi:hypothetical protein